MLRRSRGMLGMLLAHASSMWHRRARRHESMHAQELRMQEPYMQGPLSWSALCCCWCLSHLPHLHRFICCSSPGIQSGKLCLFEKVADPGACGAAWNPARTQGPKGKRLLLCSRQQDLKCLAHSLRDCTCSGAKRRKYLLRRTQQQGQECVACCRCSSEPSFDFDAGCSPAGG